MLLSRCLQRIGTVRADESHVRSLTVGDREALLLHLHRLTFGNELHCFLRCPQPECGETVDLDLTVGDLLLPPYRQAAPYHEMTAGERETTYRVRFRVPTGADQEAVAARLLQSSDEDPVKLFLEKCVERFESVEGGRDSADMPPSLADEIARSMAEIDPQAELRLKVKCPTCGHRFESVLDAAKFLLQKLASRSDELYLQVHILALHYHWSEADILALTAPKRRLYLELLSAEYSAAEASL
jgi:hypothetical protein